MRGRMQKGRKGLPMQAITIGPLVFAGDQLAIMAGIGLFLAATGVLGRRLAPRLDRWGNGALIMGLIAARLGHVGLHAPSVAAAPGMIVAISAAGFSLWWGIAGAVIAGGIYIRKWRSGLWAAFALGSSLSAWASLHAATARMPAIPLPTAVFQRLEGPPMALAETAGKPVIINLWASWCPPCRREMPAVALAAAHHPDIPFLFVNQGESRTAINAFLAGRALGPAQILLDPLGDLARHYGIPGLPVTLFIGPDGRLRSAHMGEISTEEIDDTLVPTEMDSAPSAAP